MVRRTSGRRKKIIIQDCQKGPPCKMELYRGGYRIRLKTNITNPKFKNSVLN